MRAVERREAISLAVAAGAALLWPGTAPAQDLPESQPQLVAFLLAGELLSVAAVRSVLTQPHLRGRSRALAARILAAERTHVAALTRAARQLGAPAPALASPFASVEAIDRGLATRHVHRSVSDLHSEHDCLDLLLGVESMAEGLYYSAIPKLADPTLRRLAAGILAVEAQHEAMLGILRDPKNFDQAAPYAFVEGTKP